MEQKLYKQFLLSIASGGITSDDAKELLNTLLPAIFTGLCTEYIITPEDTRYDNAILFIKQICDRAMDYFIDYQPEEQTFEEV